MKISELIKDYDFLKIESKYSRISIIIMSLTIFVMLIALLNKDSYITVVPYTLSEDAEISKSKASASYKEAWAFLFAQELGNITTKDFDFVKSRLEPLLSPTIHTEFLNKLDEQMTHIKEDKVSLSFTPALVMYEPDSDKVFVFGRSEIINALGYKTVESRTYEMTFRMNTYAPQLTHFITYEGEPKDQRVLDRLRKEEQKRMFNEQRKREKEREKQ